MIKKLFDKIKSIFKKEEKTYVECPYKIEPQRCEDCSPDINIAVNIEPEVMHCSHCNTELKGKVSNKDENNDYYIWCRECNYVNKIHNEKVVQCPQTADEVTKAFKLFMKSGNAPSQYSMSKNGEKKSFE